MIRQTTTTSVNSPRQSGSYADGQQQKQQTPQQHTQQQHLHKQQQQHTIQFQTAGPTQVEGTTTRPVQQSQYDRTDQQTRIQPANTNRLTAATKHHGHHSAAERDGNG
ncbi:centrosomal and chromosomal factor-like isoform X2 [Topomyia yanbarensis]|uniref:centrosomal and chromosomal factor-like isoform X2 n=1 Tax=Topomyia yanbarensis TaxID=2498891 RepID=UPI00273C55D6|nr:centrosomal and chromosomal factor-like isoform X2 [Topomyia yanbarensis]XP_058837378.1 centrosomal and chromosomal factor-like isoform X2 [Topomyia yanbarensis]XP_058837696.1 centrosomal and chromosomal factor-like isoform X2 [Topomyia yanbarensis]